VFTDLTKADLDAAMAKYEVSDYARTGTVATDTILIESGPVHGPHGGLMEHTMEPTLRKNGMPTKLNRGVIELLADHTLCREGDHVSPQGAILLRLFGHELATFKLDLLCGWVSICTRTFFIASPVQKVSSRSAVTITRIGIT
jgi:mRNA turnover protein 4